jgi:hypothetical protein
MDIEANYRPQKWVVTRYGISRATLFRRRRDTPGVARKIGRKVMIDVNALFKEDTVCNPKAHCTHRPGDSKTTDSLGQVATARELVGANSEHGGRS